MTQDTATYADSLKAHKDLKDEYAILVQTRDRLKDEVKTYADAKTIIMDEISKLGFTDVATIKRRILDDQTSMARVALEKVKKETESLEQLSAELARSIAEKHTHHLEAITELTEARSQLQAVRLLRNDETDSLNAFKAEKEKEMESTIATLKKHRDEASELSDKIDAYQAEYQQKLNHISASERRLATKEHDLNIYESRIRTKAAELFPDMQIIL